MGKSNLYETIFKRKSIRKYDVCPLDEKMLFEIREYINNVKPLYPEIRIEMRIAQRHEIMIIMPIKAPHYLLFYSEDKEGSLVNAGYMLQQIDLFLSLNNIGSCYLGLAQATKGAKESSKLGYVITLAFGNASEMLHRTAGSEFRRKPLLQITDITNNVALLETARLAPSASNTQPWFFTGGDGFLHAYCVNPNSIKTLIYKKINKIDMGIVLYHLDLALQHDGKEIIFSIDETAQANPPKGYYYVATLNFS